MTCAATRQGDEMYCSRCQVRWAANEPKTAACAPVDRRGARRKALEPPAPTGTPGGAFDARAFMLARRGWVSSPGVLDRMEIIAREAYAAGVKDGKVGT